MELYWLLRLPHLHDLVEKTGFAFIILLIICIFMMIMASNYQEKDYKTCCRWMTFWGICSFICFLICAFIPTKTDLALMMGWDAMKSDSVAEIIEILKDKIK